jgi:ABC-type amino acid transport substrate-binding protein
MRALWVSIAIFIFLCSLGFAEDPVTRIYYMTENYPPGNWLENGKLTGASVEILKAIDQQGKYFAFHKSTPSELFQRFQTTLKSLGNEQDSILVRYNLHG